MSTRGPPAQPRIPIQRWNDTHARADDLDGRRFGPDPGHGARRVRRGVGVVLGRGLSGVRLVIADAIRRGEIPPGDLELKTSLIVGAIVQAVDSRILSRLKGRLSDSAQLTAECCSRMLGA